MVPMDPLALRQASLGKEEEQILQEQSRPMTGGALAQEALKAGYLTSSKNFAQSVWTALGLMKTVENVKGQGYRLKRGKS